MKPQDKNCVTVPRVLRFSRLATYKAVKLCSREIMQQWEAADVIFVAECRVQIPGKPHFLRVNIESFWNSRVIKLKVLAFTSVAVFPPKLETIHITSSGASFSSVQSSNSYALLSAKTDHLSVTPEWNLDSFSTILMDPKFRAIWTSIVLTLGCALLFSVFREGR